MGQISIVYPHKQDDQRSEYGQTSPRASRVTASQQHGTVGRLVGREPDNKARNDRTKSRRPWQWHIWLKSRYWTQYISSKQFTCSLLLFLHDFVLFGGKPGEFCRACKRGRLSIRMCRMIVTSRKETELAAPHQHLHSTPTRYVWTNLIIKLINVRANCLSVTKNMIVKVSKTTFQVSETVLLNCCNIINFL